MTIKSREEPRHLLEEEHSASSFFTSAAALRQRALRSTWVAWMSIVSLCGCAVVYPEIETPTHAPKDGQTVEPAPPPDLYYIYFEGASVPPKTPGGLEWPGGAPDPFAKLIVNDVELFRTPTQSKTRQPSWPDQKAANYRIAKHSRIYVEVWDDNPMTNKPICRAAVRDFENMAQGGNNEIWCDSGARVRLVVEPAKALVGMGLWFEVRGTEGVRVTRVAPNSPASRAGLSEGDRILAINGKQVKGLNEKQVQSAVNSSIKKGISLDVWFKSGERHLVKLEEGAIYPLFKDDLQLPSSMM